MAVLDCLRYVAVETTVLSYCCKTYFLKENIIRISAKMPSTKNRIHFMNAYYKETEKPFGYLFVDSKPDTPAEEQVLADLFGVCYVYHFGVKTPVETKPKTHFATKVNSTTTKSTARLQGNCKLSPSQMQLLLSGKNTPWEHRRSVKFPKDILTPKCTTHHVMKTISLSVEVC